MSQCSPLKTLYHSYNLPNTFNNFDSHFSPNEHQYAGLSPRRASADLLKITYYEIKFHRGQTGGYHHCETNPLQDIRSLENNATIALVMKDGKVVKDRIH